MEKPSQSKLLAAVELVDTMFEQDLADTGKYDPDVASIVRKHLGGASIHSRAGVRLAEALVELAQVRARQGEVDK